jgi:hypothetical protein
MLESRRNTNRKGCGRKGHGTFFKVPSQHLPSRTEENHDKLGQNSRPPDRSGISQIQSGITNISALTFVCKRICGVKMKFHVFYAWILG